MSRHLSTPTERLPRATTPRGAPSLVEGEIPAARVHQRTQRLPGLTRGEGVLESAFGHYQPVPTRPRTGNDPLDRKRYLLRVRRRVPG
jgi:ribosomal protection tetracycline resistance protein